MACLQVYIKIWLDLFKCLNTWLVYKCNERFGLILSVIYYLACLQVYRRRGLTYGVSKILGLFTTGLASNVP